MENGEEGGVVSGRRTTVLVEKGEGGGGRWYKGWKGEA